METAGSNRDTDPITLDEGVVLCWNRDYPDAWPFDDYVETRSWILDDGPQETFWSVGNRRNIQPGTHAFLLGQGLEFPRGLIGHGLVTAPPETRSHWKKKGATTNYVKVLWDILLPFDEPVPIQDLIETAPQLPWRTGIPGSGFPVKPEAVSALLILLDEFAPDLEEAGPGELGPDEHWEGAVRSITVNRYERDPKARLACLEHHGYICQACDADLTQTYGDEFGRRAIHVHHVIPMATRGEEYRLDPIRDLVPLCPNCHNVIHKTDPVLTPVEFRKQILRK